MKEMAEIFFSGVGLTDRVSFFDEGFAGKVTLSDAFFLSSIVDFSGLISNAKEPLVTIRLIGDGEPAI